MSHDTLIDMISFPFDNIRKPLVDLTLLSRPPTDFYLPYIFRTFKDTSKQYDIVESGL